MENEALLAAHPDNWGDVDDFFDRMAKGERPTEKDIFKLTAVKVAQKALFLMLSVKRSGNYDEHEVELKEIGSAINPSGYYERVINDEMTVKEGYAEIDRIRALIRNLEEKINPKKAKQ